MTCQELIDFLMDFVDDELAPEQRRVFERHLAECPACVEYVDSYRKTVEMGCEVCKDDEEPPQDVPDDLVQAILNARRANERGE